MHATRAAILIVTVAHLGWQARGTVPPYKKPNQLVLYGQQWLVPSKALRITTQQSWLLKVRLKKNAIELR